MYSEEDGVVSGASKEGGVVSGVSEEGGVVSVVSGDSEESDGVDCRAITSKRASAIPLSTDRQDGRSMGTMYSEEGGDAAGRTRRAPSSASSATIWPGVGFLLISNMVPRCSSMASLVILVFLALWEAMAPGKLRRMYEREHEESRKSVRLSQNGHGCL